MLRRLQIVFIGFSVALGSVYVLVRDSRPDVILAVSGTLMQKEMSVVVARNVRGPDTTYYDTSLILDGRGRKFVFREYEKHRADKYFPKFVVGSNLELFIHKHTKLVQGFSRDGVLVVDPVFKHNSNITGYWWLAAFGCFVVLLGLFLPRLEALLYVFTRHS